MFELNIVGKFPTDDTGMFNSKDATVIKSPAWQERVRKLYADCPAPLNVTIVGVTIDEYYETIYGHVPHHRNRWEVVGDSVSHLGHREERVKNLLRKLGVFPKEDVINVCLVNNEARPYFPLTPWIFGHRVSHAICGFSGYSNLVSKSLREEINWFYCRALDILKTRGDIEEGHYEWERNCEVFKNIGTMKSARDGDIRVWGEFVVEGITQWLSSGWMDVICPTTDDDGLKNEWADRLDVLNSQTLPSFFKGKITEKMFHYL